MQNSTVTDGTALVSTAQAGDKNISSSNEELVDNTTPEPDSAHGWLIVAGSTIYTMMSLGTTSAIGVYIDEYLVNVFPDAPSSTLAWIGTMQFGLLCFFGIIFGAMAERIDVRIVGTIGALVSGAGLLIASACFLPLVAHCYTRNHMWNWQWMDRYKPIAVDIAISGSAIGGVWQPFVMRAIIKHHGYQWALRISGLLQIVICGVATLPMRRRVDAPPRGRLVEYTLLLEPKFLMLFLFGIVGSAGLFFPFSYMPNYAIAVLHKDISWDANISAILNVGAFFGRLLSGVLAAYIGSINTLIICSFLSSLVLLVLWLPFKNIAVLIVEALLFGAFSGSQVTVYPMIAGNIYGLRRLPSVLGTVVCIPVYRPAYQLPCRWPDAGQVWTWDKL
ncbi:MFS general substrate transporter [Linderina pennispora]|uniref:MFS general substrate transporter n=1 Tax=Linderina pennispora TaxID=61395 RepID=A0A1Y1WG87_9FUNG|nr:MFS general substrate transporter [Linderina pennispora]ORX72415.1 MFS general substrate transporter [Linderina pennispora]